MVTFQVLADGNFPPPERSARSEGDGPDDIGGRSEPNRSHNDGKILIPAPGLLLSGAPRDGSDAKARSVHGVDDTGSSTGAPPSSPSGPRESDIAGSLQPWDVLSWGPTMRWASWTCTICLGAYHVGESVTWSSNSECDHCFHTSCIEEWLLRRPPYRPPRRQQARETGGNSYAVPACPNCRRDFVKDPYEIDG